jgi:hypothetical protein
MSRARRFAKSIVACTYVLTIAAALIRPSQSVGQTNSIQIGPDQSKASMAETLSWLKQRVPELGSFNEDLYDTATSYAKSTPGTLGPLLGTTWLTSVHQKGFDFKWIAVNGCEVQYELRKEGGVSVWHFFTSLSALRD